MGIDGRFTSRRKARAVTSARLAVAACLAACAITGRPSLRAQGVPPDRPSAIEQLRAVVGTAPTNANPAGPPPRQGAEPAPLPLIVPPALTPEPATHGSPRLDRVARLIDALTQLNRTSPPAPPPLLPVAALIPEREGVPAVLEMPKPTEAEDVPAIPEAAVGPAGPRKAARAALCLVLTGAALVLSAFLVARRIGLTVRVRVSLRPAAPRG